MTDISRSPTTQPVPLIDSIVGSNATPLHPLPNLPNGFTVEEEEDYTIKCICDYQDDDGNTVLCETCETWQHIECYYAGKNPPGEHETHTCVDCEPRLLDGKSATERQRAKREDRDLGDRKVKKQATKSHKKKIKPLESHHSPTNGWPLDKHDIASPRNNTNNQGSKDQPTKRHKSNHKPSNSLHSQSVPLKLPSQSRRSTSASYALQSPSKASNHHTPSDCKTEPFSDEFIHLYDNDPGDTPMQANLFNDIRITNLLALWSSDVEALTEATHGKTPQEIFMRSDPPVGSMTQPINKHTKLDSEVECHGRNPKWTYLTNELTIFKNSVVGELRGRIGHMDDYTKDEANRWEYLRHPLPFVFFHNSLPIYIDTRQEGTLLRYVRRSCQANLMMKTFLENGSDYHFCWMASKDIEPGTELTIPWTVDEHVRSFTQKFNGIKYEGSVDTDESYVTDFCAKVLADFGGCACNGPEQCTFKSYASRNRVVSAEQCQTNGKSKKGRRNAAHSAHGTTRDGASRSGSEALKYLEDDDDDDDQDDGQSTSASSRSKPHSRDMTPSHQQRPVDNKNMILAPDISDREKRKIAQLEKMGQDKGQPQPKKKKRNSGGSMLSTPATATTKHQGVESLTTPIPSNKHCVDASTSRNQSGSPIARSPFAPTSAPASVTAKSPSLNHSPTTASPLMRSNYVDNSVQTDSDPDGDWLSPRNTQSMSQKPYVSLKRRLLDKCHREKLLRDEYRMAQQSAKTEDIQKEKESIPSPLAVTSQFKDMDGDIVMHTTEPNSPAPEVAISPTVEKPRPPDEIHQESSESFQIPVSPLQPPPPGQNNSPTEPPKEQPLNGFRSTDLRVQLPPKPVFNGNPLTPTVAITPTMAQSPLVQTPAFPGVFASALNIVQPSPIKKKLSLGDYMSRRSSHHQRVETPSAAGNSSSAKDLEDSPTTTNTGGTAKSLAALAEEATDHNMEGSAITGTPRAEVGDPMDVDMDKIQ